MEDTQNCSNQKGVISLYFMTEAQPFFKGLAGAFSSQENSSGMEKSHTSPCLWITDLTHGNAPPHLLEGLELRRDGAGLE